MTTTAAKVLMTTLLDGSGERWLLSMIGEPSWTRPADILEPADEISTDSRRISPDRGALDFQPELLRGG